MALHPSNLRLGRHCRSKLRFLLRFPDRRRPDHVYSQQAKLPIGTTAAFFRWL